MYPIFGTLTHDNRQDNAFLGFTKSHILVVLVSGKRITDTFRLPLDIKHVRVKRTKVFHQYLIDIAFKNERPVRITTYCKVMSIGTQKDNFPLFLEHLKSKAANPTPPALKNIGADKIRWQYFNIWIYMFCMLFSAVPIALLMFEIKNGNYSMEEITALICEIFPIFLVTLTVCITPFIFLSILNRFFFGKVLCVIKDGILLLENEEIYLKDIKKIVYNPQLPSKHSTKYTYATLYVDPPKKKDYWVNIEHFPIYGVRKLKKYNPRITFEYDRFVVFIILAIYAATIIFPFFM